MPPQCLAALLLGCIVWTPAAQCPDDPDVDLCEWNRCPDDPEVDLCDWDHLEGVAFITWEDVDVFAGCPDDPEVDLCDDVDYPTPTPSPAGCPDDPEVDLCDDVDYPTPTPSPAPAPSPTIVELSMSLIVDDPAAFVAAASSQLIVETGIANSIPGVDVDDVVAVLTAFFGRRLGNHEGGSVNVAATITAADAAAANAIAESPPAAAVLTTNIQAAATEMGATVTITVDPSSVSAVAVSPGGGSWDGNWDTGSWTYPEDATWNAIQRSVCGTGREQSPINLRVCPSNSIVPATDAIVPSNWGPAQSLSYSRGIIIDVPPGTFQTSMRGQMYTMERCSLHSGSEHYFDGVQEALSMECFHSKDGVDGRYGALSFIWKIGSADVSFLSTVIDNAPGPGEPAVATEAVNMELAYDGINLNHYWQYDGSLTIPPCTEVVDWHVLMEKRTMSRGQFDSMRAKVAQYGDGNFRRPKPLYGRQVLGCQAGWEEDEFEQDGASQAGWRVAAVALSILMTLAIC